MLFRFALDFRFPANMFCIGVYRAQCNICITDGIRERVHREYATLCYLRRKIFLIGKSNANYKIAESYSCFREFWVRFNSTEFWVELPLAFDYSAVTLHKKWSFPLRISSVNLQFPNPVIFTEEILTHINALILMPVHRYVTLSNGRIVDIFSQKHPKKSFLYFHSC